jgi:hypothetical protein
MITARICDLRNGVRGQFARHQSRAAHVRFGSKADIGFALVDVRFAERQKPARMMCDYSMLVFALNLIDVWLPSQNGLFFEAPQRQTVMRLRISYW